MNQTHTVATEPTIHTRSAGPMAEQPTRQQRQPEWFFYSAGGVLGPFTMAEMTRFVGEGRLSSDVEVTRRDVPDWKPASANALLAPLFKTFDGDHRPKVATNALSTRPEAPRVTIWPAVPTAPPRGATATEGVEIEQDMGAPNPSAGEEGPDAMARAPFVAQIPNRYAAAFPGTSRDAGPATTREPERNALTGAEAHLADRNMRVLLAGWVSLMSLIVPGAGQLANGQLPRAVVFLLLIFVAWSIGLGWVLHVWAAVDAWRGSIRISVGDR